MPGPFQAVLPRSFGEFGWASVYYPVAGTHEEAAGIMDTINTAEAGLLSNDVTLGLMRISDMSVSGDVLLRQPTKTKGTFTPDPGPAVGACDPNLAVPMKFEAGVTHRATKFLRGVPVSLVTHLGRATFTPDQTWGNNSVLFETAVEQHANVMTRVGGPPPILTPHLITNVVHLFVGGPIRMSIRRAGRPFGLPRGRARVG